MNSKRLKLKQLRVAQDMTQEQFARKVNYSRAQYNLIETGKRNGTDEFWFNLQKTFNIPDSEMWGFKKCGSAEEKKQNV